ncbi:hypothetical protein CXF79_06330 [Colwellia sp. Bg11-28]|nr:hypothetical protein CXF79_06330 [Colwellia sp. Bg11-28]
MFPKCFNCSNNIPLSWFLGAFMWTKHRCVACGELHEFTNSRRLYSGLVGAGVVLIPSLLDGIISSQGVRFLLIGLILFLVLSIIPGQHRLIPNKSVDVK